MVSGRSGWMRLGQRRRGASSLRNPLSRAGAGTQPASERKESPAAAAVAGRPPPPPPPLPVSPSSPSLPAWLGTSPPPAAPQPLRLPRRGPSLRTTARFSCSPPQREPDAPLGCQDNSSIGGLAGFLKKRGWSLEVLCKRKGRRRGTRAIPD